MSIATRTGDGGETALMFNRRVSKCDIRVEACGAVDELNAALGVAKVAILDPARKELLQLIQASLIGLMGGLATDTADYERYRKAGLTTLPAEAMAEIDRALEEYEAGVGQMRGWSTPGGTATSAALDVARTVCRRAERRVCALKEARQLNDLQTLTYLNRLADLLWLMARAEETGGSDPQEG